MSKYLFVLAAAGHGSRLGGAIPKQYLELHDGRSVLDCTIARLLKSAVAEQVLVALAADDQHFAQRSVYHQHRQVDTIIGGATRARSVANAVAHAREHHGEQCWLLVHDAARPFVDVDDLRRLVAHIEHNNSACALAARVRDSSYRASANGQIKASLDTDLWRAFTPQAARVADMVEALRIVGTGAEVRDEISALRASGRPTQLLDSSSLNFKITTMEDLNLARRLARTLL